MRSLERRPGRRLLLRGGGPLGRLGDDGLGCDVVDLGRLLGVDVRLEVHGPEGDTVDDGELGLDLLRGGRLDLGGRDRLLGPLGRLPGRRLPGGCGPGGVVGGRSRLVDGLDVLDVVDGLDVVDVLDVGLDRLDVVDGSTCSTGAAATVAASGTIGMASVCQARASSSVRSNGWYGAGTSEAGAPQPL